MSLNSSRTATSVTRQALRQCRHQRPTAFNRPTAAFATSAAHRAEQVSELPRWSRTPEKMRAPFSPHITKDPARSRWRVNEDPKKLDDALNSFLGRDGERLLPDELKWLAVTHKSFDQGRRGFNDRLAFLGRQICAFEATQSIITSSSNPPELENDPYEDQRKPYEDAALRSLDNLSSQQPNDVFSLDKLTKLALDAGLPEVVRWKPRMPENIKGSGFNVIMSGAVYALVGAVSLQHGGKVASRVVRERIMKKMRP